MQVTLTHINGKKIRRRWMLHAIRMVQEFENAVDDICRIPPDGFRFPHRVKEWRGYARFAIEGRQVARKAQSDDAIQEWRALVIGIIQELEAKLTLLELSGQL